MDKKYEKLVPLKFIRIAKDLNREEFSKYFLCTTAYISSIEIGKRVMHIRTLKSGLREMGISIDDYMKLEELKEILIKLNVEEEVAYRTMLSRALGIINPDLKTEAEELVKAMLNKTSKHR